jgi:hypothetical protein
MAQSDSVRFPTDAERLRERIEAERGMTFEQRIDAIAGILNVIDALSSDEDRQRRAAARERRDAAFREQMSEWIKQRAR